MPAPTIRFLFRSVGLPSLIFMLLYGASTQPVTQQESPAAPAEEARKNHPEFATGPMRTCPGEFPSVQQVILPSKAVDEEGAISFSHREKTKPGVQPQVLIFLHGLMGGQRTGFALLESSTGSRQSGAG